MCKKLLFHCFGVIVLMVSMSAYATPLARKNTSYQHAWEDQRRAANIPTGAVLHAKLADTADSFYFGYVETPKGIRESFAGAMGRGVVNAITNMPFDIMILVQIGVAKVANFVGATETVEAIWEEIVDTEVVKRDLTAHPSYYWADVEDTVWQMVGAGMGSVTAAVVLKGSLIAKVLPLLIEMLFVGLIFLLYQIIQKLCNPRLWEQSKEKIKTV